tara:strand:+ start:194 stop:436 length:243 start_codon:yes stop_codon:yes gene_type:complete
MLSPQQRQQETQRLFMKYFSSEMSSNFLIDTLECFEEHYPILQTLKNLKKDALILLCKNKGINPRGKKNDLIVRLFFNET